VKNYEKYRRGRPVGAYTRMGLFHPGAGPAFFRVLYPMAALGSLLLAAGIWVKTLSAFLYATAVS
jgi:hypothetical protein